MEETECNLGRILDNVGLATNLSGAGNGAIVSGVLAYYPPSALYLPTLISLGLVSTPGIVRWLCSLQGVTHRMYVISTNASDRSTKHTPYTQLFLLLFFPVLQFVALLEKSCGHYLSHI